jgi:hypothetical protein|tara:strand:- start:850 stop:1089 length:240 start_codon:yes stop_codon:yes gene_type:complete
MENYGLYEGVPLQQYLDDMRKFTKDLTSGPDAKEKCGAFLMSAGIADSEGNLTEPYRSDDLPLSKKELSELEQKADEHL